MSYPGALTITVNIEFPNGDRTAEPVVTNSCDEIDSVRSTYSAVEWALTSNLPVGSDENLALTGVTFYTDACKRTTFDPPYFQNPGFSNGRRSWVIKFNAATVPDDSDLTYDLLYQDDLFANLRWDPTLTIQKRNLG